MKLLTVMQAADRLGLRPATIRSWIWARRIQYVKLGRSVRLREDTIDEIIEAGTIPALDKQ
jgi:excisionase family DNA binding protein